MEGFKYYLIHNGKRVYFSFDMSGFKEAQAYCAKHKLGKKKKLFVTKERESK